MLLSKTLINKIILPFFLIYATSAAAQKNDDSSASKQSYFKVSLGYLSNAIYYGRKDSLALPYIIPAISYHDKSGLYLEASLSYLAGAGAQIDAGDITAGYEFESKSGKLSEDLYAAKYFTNRSSYSVKGDVKGAVGGTLDYNTGLVTMNTGADLAFSGNTDVVITFGLSHAFEFGDNKNWQIAPSALLNAGTQNFYKSYLTNRKYSVRRRRASSTPVAVNIIVASKNFAVLDYELSVPVDYAAKKWGLYFTPTFSVPENGFKYSLNNGVTYRAEKLSNSFYAEAGVYLKF